MQGREFEHKGKEGLEATQLGAEDIRELRDRITSNVLLLSTFFGEISRKLYPIAIYSTYGE